MLSCEPIGSQLWTKQMFDFIRGSEVQDFLIVLCYLDCADKRLNIQRLWPSAVTVSEFLRGRYEYSCWRNHISAHFLSQLSANQALKWLKHFLHTCDEKEGEICQSNVWAMCKQWSCLTWSVDTCLMTGYSCDIADGLQKTMLSKPVRKCHGGRKRATGVVLFSLDVLCYLCVQMSAQPVFQTRTLPPYPRSRCMKS